MILLRSPKRRQATTTQKTTNDILKNSYENIIISLFKRFILDLYEIISRKYHGKKEGIKVV